MLGYILYGTYRIQDETPIIHLYGRAKNKEAFLLKIPFKPYLFIPADSKVNNKEETELTDFSGKKVAKVYAKVPPEIPELRKGFEEAGIKTYEADIRFVQRFYIDNDIQGIIDIKGEHTTQEGIRVYENPRITPKPPYEVKLQTLALDIETDKNVKQIYSVSLVDHKVREVHIISDRKVKGATSYKDEASLLKGLIRRIQELDPDIITGWNLIDFDLRVIRERCKFHDIPLGLGRNKEIARIRIQHDFFRESSADIPGRIVFDGISLVKQAYNLEDYKLDTVASELLGEKKVELEEGFWDNFEEIVKTHPEKVVEYNLKDSELVIKILQKTKLIELMIKKSLITGLQLDRVRGSIAALDSLYIRKAHKKGYVCPNAGFDDSNEKIKGAYVMTPKPGIYENVVVLDFKSLYPSVIRTFNIDPISHNKDGTIVAPNKARFRNDQGILPEIIEESWNERDKAKKENDIIKSNAIKIIMNSFYGVLANPTCRFYNLDMANAITSFARHIIRTTEEIITDKGYNVLYGDTDSVFVDLNTKDPKKAESIGNSISKDINKHFADEIKEKYGRDSILELEFEKMFKVLILPRIRGKTGGAKKRYAGLLVKDGKEEIKVTGMELVRRDWTDLAKEFQMELLKRVFHKKEVSGYIKDTIKNVNKGKFDDKLIYRKSIRKDLDEYTKTTPPHVKAARKLDTLRSNIITYVITQNGPEPVEKLESPIDYEHYIEKQLRPIAQTILELYGIDFDELISGSSQKNLFDY
ncbi:MAG: DNA polymerase II [Candidatus Woesearchaeota archaeon]